MPATVRIIFPSSTESDAAAAYAAWAGRRPATEAVWTYVAQGGMATNFPWGDERAPRGEEHANT
ncbi:MAG: SUMF1/EgtB/PvdO family nonheme iron enzyme [Pseudomonadota bacterium]